jgi:ubiquinone/menaquinone biosynthesis C-methylase UbiE
MPNNHLVHKIDDAFDIWGTERAREYEPFAVRIISDKPAYEVVSWLIFQSLLRQSSYLFQGVSLDLSLLNVLDFGCFRGESSVWLHKNTGARILGVDSSSNDIDQAISAVSDEGVIFKCVGKDESIPVEGQIFHAASMTFVHPTISSLVELNSTISKISEVTLPGGSLVMLGLNPKSLGEEYQYVYYGHSLVPGTVYEDGKPFNNELRLSPEEIMRFQDYCWTEDTIVKLLEQNGYKNIRIINLHEELENHLGEVLRNAIEKYSNGQVWEDEWTAPLYQVIYAEKV